MNEENDQQRNFNLEKNFTSKSDVCEKSPTHLSNHNLVTPKYDTAVETTIDNERAIIFKNSKPIDY